MPKFKYEWNLADGYPAEGAEHHGHTVMSTFACGGGSSMGYKLAGYDVIAANDIDPQMEHIYTINHHPKQFFLCPIKNLLTRNDLPEVDVLDGSPPCSTFSMAGSREKAWGVEKKFREGQAKQELDKLFFDYLDLVEKMQPKVAIAENVEGIIRGKAIKYANAIVTRFKRLGYNVDVFLCDSTNMGLPQARRRVFFIANRLGKHIQMQFSEKPILWRDVRKGTGTLLRPTMTQTEINYWHDVAPGESMGVFQAGKKKLHLDKVPCTVASTSIIYDCIECRTLYKEELDCISSFPHDYDYGQHTTPQYVQGMSVPPVMMAQVSWQVYEQLLKGK